MLELKKSVFCFVLGLLSWQFGKDTMMIEYQVPFGSEKCCHIFVPWMTGTSPATVARLQVACRLEEIL